MNDLIVRDGFLIQGRQRYRCAIGRNGLTDNPMEGDHATPIGLHPLRRVLYRPDRIEQPITVLPVTTLTPSDGWSDDPKDIENYNQFVEIPHSYSHERLWREEHVYDLIVVVGFNDDPVVLGRGSAIFMHIARKGYTPTEGCVALAKNDLLEVLKGLGLQNNLDVRS